MSGRYATSTEKLYVSPEGLRVTYLEPRILAAPPPAAATTTVRAEEVHRLDLVANRALRAPLLAWRLADANAAMDPFDLCAVAGRAIAIPPSAL